jgi:hypothetical protein
MFMIRVPGCRLVLGSHFRSRRCLRSLGGNARLDAARRRRPLHCVARPDAHAERVAHAGIGREERKLPMKFSWVEAHIVSTCHERGLNQQIQK